MYHEFPTNQNFDALPASGTQEPASNIQINLNEPVIMASFLLPYQIQRDARSGKLSIHTSLHNPTIMYGTLESMIQKKQINLKWVGLVTTPCELSEVEKDQLYLQFQKKGAYPIFMTAEETAPFLIFYENHIRLLFHNFKDLNNINNHTSKHWDSYVELNQKFAKEILAVRAKLKNVPKQIFIHNNHLLMVPALVRKQFQEANIGLFFHSPFPNSSHFQTAKFRFEMLKSLLHCDLICFNLFIHAKNFIRSVQKLFGFELEFYPEGYFGIDFHGKKVLIRVSHVGIDQNFIQELTKSRMFKAHQISFNNALKKHLMQIKENNNLDGNNKQFSQNERPIIMSSIDSYHPMSGLKNKLLSYKLFLQRYPNYRNRIVLIQFVGSILQTYSFVQNHQKQLFLIKKMRNDVIQLRDEIHKEFGQGCLIFQESNPPLEKRLVLWTQSNIILCSALKDGLCIQLLEYVVCRKLINKFSQSAMICSEFAGCSEAMKGVMMFNPFSLTDFHEILDQAISQTPETNDEQMKIAYSYVCRNSMTQWTINFLKDLKYGYQPTMASYYLGLNLNPRQGKASNKIKMRSDFKQLNIDACSNSLVKAKKSVIIIEIEAMPTRKFSKNSIPRTEVIEQLHNIMNDNRNIVVIIGNQTQQTLEDWFIKQRPCGINGNTFWLAAESGYLYKTGASVGGQWQQQTELLDVSWMQKVRKIMSEFEENIDGSFIEERQSQILWNYKFADPEQSMLFIHDLYNKINKIAEQEQIQIIQGCGYLEVKPVAIQKQNLIQIMMKSIVKNSKVDFIFYLGSSSEDEIVFEYLKSEQANNLFFSQDCAKYICVLEKKPSEADYFLEDRDQVRPLLAKLQTATQQRKKNRSYADLTKLSNNLGSLNSFKLRNMNQSIANLSQYMHANMNTNVTHLDAMNPSFYPFKKRRQSIEVMSGIIEEQSNSQLQINQMLKETKKKFASLGNATEQQNAIKITSQVQEVKVISCPSEVFLQINLGQVPSKNDSTEQKRESESEKSGGEITPRNQDQEILIEFEKSPLHQKYEDSPKGDQVKTHQFNFSNHSFEAKKKLEINHAMTVSGRKEESQIYEEFFYNQDQGNQQLYIVENSEEILGSEFESFAKESISMNLKSQKVKQFKIRKFALQNLNIQMPYDSLSFTKSLNIDHKKIKEDQNFIPHNHSTIGLQRQEQRITTASIFNKIISKTQAIPGGAHSTNELFKEEQKLDYEVIQDAKKEQVSDNLSSMSDGASFSLSSCEASIIRCQSINEQNPRKLKFSTSYNWPLKKNVETPRINGGDVPFLMKQVTKNSDTYGLKKYNIRATKSVNFNKLEMEAYISKTSDFRVKNHLLNEEDSIYCGSELKAQEQILNKQESPLSAGLKLKESSSSIDYLIARKLSQIPKNKQRINFGLDQQDTEYLNEIELDSNKNQSKLQKISLQFVLNQVSPDRLESDGFNEEEGYQSYSQMLQKDIKYDGIGKE